jgi:aryl-phospho-beta-D-glucosidase BglC (GH1 family)
MYAYTSLEVYDKTVGMLTGHGLMVIVNNHVSDAKRCCAEDDGNGLWYTKKFNERKYFAAMEGMTKRYLDNPMVIGNDLRNAPRPDTKLQLTPTWGDFNKETDWFLAARTAGNKILDINPNLLIFVEGLNFATDL